MRFSQLHWRYKLYALLLFVGVISLIAVIWRWIVFDVLPEELAVGLGLVAIGFAIGSYTGEAIAKREAKRPPLHYWPDEEA